jgi:hypothetical protein
MPDHPNHDRELYYYHGPFLTYSTCYYETHPFKVAIVILSLILVLVIGLFIWYVIRHRSFEAAKPIVIVPSARVVTKQFINQIFTWYYITFVDNGDNNATKITFKVGKTDYRNLEEGDVGELTYQGTRYKGFILCSTVEQQQPQPQAEIDLEMPPAFAPHPEVPQDPPLQYMKQ